MAATTELDPKEVLKKNGEDIGALTKAVDGLVKTLSKSPDYGRAGADPNQVLRGAPAIRKGEDTMTSRGFSFAKMIGVMAGHIPPEQATVEVDVSNRLQAGFKNGPWEYKWGGHPSVRGHQFLAPLGTGMLPDECVDRNFRHEMKSLVLAGIDGSSDLPDEMRWIRTKQLQGMGYSSKALSWLQEFNGGALVPPPEFGELIELLRNREALVNAGARVIPLPPQGRIQFPRQTGPSTTYWVGENTPITASQQTLGTVTMQAKKLAVLVQMPNELIRFASPAAEALVRDDMTKSLALGLDLAGLESGGSDTRPRGILAMPNITTVSATTTLPSGATKLVGQDIYRLVAAIEEANAECEGFIMRPKTLHKLHQLRWDGVAQGDAAGGFLFSLVREAGEGFKAQLAGLPVTKSTQVSQVRSTGTSGATLTYILSGMWSDLMIGMFGAIEFAATTAGDTAFQNDQTWVRGILSADIAARHETSFALLDNLDLTLS